MERGDRVNVDIPGSDYRKILDVQIKPIVVPDTGDPLALLTFLFQKQFDQEDPREANVVAFLISPLNIEQLIAKLQAAKYEIFNMGGG